MRAWRANMCRSFTQSVLSPAALAVGNAWFAGLLAFVTHRLWIGLVLGSVLAWWASLATWITMHGQQSWSQPVWDADGDVISCTEVQSLWQVLPQDVNRILPWAAGGAMISGVALAILWPRIATALNWSLAGVTLLLGAGLAMMSFARPQWLPACCRRRRGPQSIGAVGTGGFWSAGAVEAFTARRMEEAPKPTRRRMDAPSGVSSARRPPLPPLVAAL